MVLRNQLPSAPADKVHVAERAAAASSSQATVLGRLAGARPSKVLHYVLANAFAATVTTAQVAQLKADPAVASVLPDTAVDVSTAAAPAQGATGQAPSARARKPLTTLQPRATAPLAPKAAAGPAVPAAPATVNPRRARRTPGGRSSSPRRCRP